MKKEKILITGGAGYIGSVIATKALESGYKVKVLDALYYDTSTPLIHFGNPNYEFEKVDIADEAFLDKHFTDIDYVVHTAAMVGEPLSKKLPDLTSKINREASCKIIDRLKKVNIKGFIFLSTCSNYGAQDGLASEDSPLKPLSLYARTKVDVERHLMDAAKDLDWVICRLSTAYGISPRMRFDLTVNDFAMTAYTKRNLDIYLPYTYRPYIHVFDISRVVIKMIENFSRVKKNVFNVGFKGENYQKIQIAEIVKRFIQDLKIKTVTKGNDIRDYKVNFSKLKKYLDIEKTFGVEDGVRQTLRILEGRLIKNPYDPKYYNTSIDLSKLEKTKSLLGA